MFLRCELFNPKKAAIQLLTYLELAYETNGEVALRRPLRIDDLQSTEEIDVLKSGHHQILPFRDRSGRRVLALHRDLGLPSASVLSQNVLNSGPGMKLMLYLWTVSAEDIESQRKGLVVVLWPRYTNTNNTSGATPPVVLLVLLQTARYRAIKHAASRAMTQANESNEK